MAKMKGGLGRGLESLFGDSITEFEPVSVIAPDENKVPEVPESKPAAKAAAGKNASKKAGASAAAKGSKAASKTSEKAAEVKDNSIVYIKLSDIKPNSKQPRTVFDEEALDELAASIKEHGLIQPILVRPAQGERESHPAPCKGGCTPAVFLCRLLFLLFFLLPWGVFFFF